jgi:hydroxymethylbilane synthase
LDRLGHDEIGIPVDDLLPAPAQGAVGIEVRAIDSKMKMLAAAIDDAPTHQCVSAERRLLMGLGGSCRSPIAALARLEGEEIYLRAEILSMDGAEVVRGERRFPAGQKEGPDLLARELLDKASSALRALFAP